jgi:TRAP transporter TAXI family solute receptor
MRWLPCLLLAIVGALAGCARAPDEQSLRRAVEARLADALPADTIEITAIARRGTQRDASAPEGRVRRVAYYDLELRLRRDYDFGGWDAPGVAGLVSALGTGPKGLRGITAGGNRAGDVVSAHGTLLFERQGEDWVALLPQGYGPVTAPAFVQAGSASAAERLMGALRETLARAPPEASQALRGALEQELEDAYAAINSRLARFERGYAIAAGPSGGQYLRLVQAFAQDPASRIVPLVTSGGEENLRLLREGRVDIALSQGDAALAAYRGEGIFAASGPYPELRAIGSLYPEALHVVVRADSGVDSPAALRGRRVAVGVPGSAARATALAVLDAHGLTPPAVELGAYPLGAALVALRDREVDAVVTVIGIPADSIRVAATSVPLRLLDLEQSAVEALLAANPAYLRFTIPPGTYASVPRATRSIATPAMLLARADLSDAEIDAVTRRVFDSRRDLLALGSSQGAQISAPNAALGLPVPQHVAAGRTLAELAASRSDGSRR